MEMLDDVEPMLIELEDTSTLDTEAINTIFRLFHSIKGSAGFLELEDIKNLTHEAETLLDFFRKNKADITEHHIDLLIHACDILRLLLQHSIDDSLIDKDKSLAATNELKKAVDCINHGKIYSYTNDALSNEPSKSDPPIDSSNMEEDVLPVPEFQLKITTEMLKTFITESNDNLEVTEAALLGLEKDSNDRSQVDEAYRAMHSFKGNCGLFSYAQMNDLGHSFETILDKLKSKDHIIEPKLINVLLTTLDAFKKTITGLDDNEGLISNYKSLKNQLMAIDKGEAAIDIIVSQGSTRMGEILIESGDATIGDVQTALEIQNRPIGQILVDMNATSESAINQAVGLQQKRDSENMGKEGISASQKQQNIRVDVQKLDLLMNLVGELVLAENMVTHHPDILNTKLENFKKATLHLNRISRELQDVVMQVRMIPIASTFRKMIRVVRDISHKQNKMVDLQLIGEDTEVDKNVIEKISSPMLHIVRNAIDHGIEDQEQRVIAGKPKLGTLTLEATHQGGEVWIIIRDDGKGLNKDMLIQKALRKRFN